MYNEVFLKNKMSLQCQLLNQLKDRLDTKSFRQLYHLRPVITGTWFFYKETIRIVVNHYAVFS